MSRILLNRLFSKFSNQIGYNRRHARTILSDAYHCRDKWNSRLQSAVMQKVDAEEFAVKIQDKFDREGAVDAVDMDILANKFEQIPVKQLDFVQMLLHKFRHTNQSLSTEDSTSYALIRALVHLQEYDRLWEIVNDKINYGIFLDYHSVNYLIDHFLKKQMYHEAARVAYDQMLQEDFTQPICHHLSWYACHMRWQNPAVEVSQETDDKPDADAEEEEDEEEEKIIKVQFLRNPWYDDHFDIPHERWLLGKTLTMVTQNEHNLMGRSYMLIGCGLYEKFEKGVELMRKWAESEEQEAVCQEALSDFERRLESVETQESPSEQKPPGELILEDRYPYLTPQQKTESMEQFKAASDRLVSSGKVVEVYDLGGELLRQVETTVRDHQTADINHQVGLFDSWTAQRLTLIEQQIKDYKLALRTGEIKQRLEELRQREIKLSYFTNKARISTMTKRGEKLQELEQLFQTEEYLHWAPRT